MRILKPTKPPLWSLLVTLVFITACLALYFAGQVRAAFGLVGLYAVGLTGVWLPRYLWARWRFGPPRPPFGIWRGAAWKRCIEVIGDIEPICQMTGKKGAPSSLYWFVVSNDDGSWEYAIETSGGCIQGFSCSFQSSKHGALNFSWSVSGDDFIDCNGDGCWSATALDAMKQVGKPTKQVGQHAFPSTASTLSSLPGHQNICTS